MAGAPEFEYTDELGKEICDTVACSPTGLSKLCADRPHWPKKTTIYKWRVHIPSFAEQYARARLAQADVLAEDCTDIADDDSNDTIIDPETGQPKCNHEWIARSRLRLDTRKWLAAKFLPKLYCDRQQVDTNVTINHEDTLKELG
jgi:hypothetical protein